MIISGFQRSEVIDQRRGIQITPLMLSVGSAISSSLRGLTAPVSEAVPSPLSPAHGPSPILHHTFFPSHVFGFNNTKDIGIWRMWYYY